MTLAGQPWLKVREIRQKKDGKALVFDQVNERLYFLFATTFRENYTVNYSLVYHTLILQIS